MPGITTQKNRYCDNIIQNGGSQSITDPTIHRKLGQNFYLCDMMKTQTYFQIWINVFNLHHDERYWDKPWDFIPERFLDEEGRLVTADHPNRRRYMQLLSIYFTRLTLQFLLFYSYDEGAIMAYSFLQFW